MSLLSLGDLEMAVMEFYWGRNSGDVKDVHDVVGVVRGVTSNTIQSTIKRLYEKGFLDRCKVSHAYIYSAKVKRVDFQRLLLESVVRGGEDSRNDELLSAVVDWAARAGRDRLERLEALVNERLLEVGTGTDVDGGEG